MAVLGARATTRRAADLARIALSDARGIVAALVRADVLDDGEPLRFVHPLVRSSVHEDLAAADRVALHRRAAGLLAAEGADPEAVAVHLLHSDPAGDADAVAILREAARTALGRGGPETAAACLRRALEEPPDAIEHGWVLLELGAAEAQLAEAAAAARHLGAARDMLPPAGRYVATRMMAGVLGMSERPDEAVRLLVDAAQREGTQDGDRLPVDAVNVARMSQSAWPLARETARRLREKIELAGVEQAGEVDAEVLACVAGEMVQAGEQAQRTADLAERALDMLVPPQLWTLADWSGLVAVRTLIATERFGRARLALDAVVAALQSRGDAVLAGIALAYRADLLHRLGDVRRAEEDAVVAERLCLDHGWSVGLPAAVAWRIIALLERGDAGSADALLDDHGLLTSAAALPDAYTFNLLLDARGRLRSYRDGSKRRPRTFSSAAADSSRSVSRTPRSSPGADSRARPSRRRRH